MAYADLPVSIRTALRLPPDDEAPYRADMAFYADIYEERYGEFSDFGRGNVPHGFAICLLLLIVVTLLACGLGYLMAHALLEAMRVGAAEAAVRGRF